MANTTKNISMVYDTAVIMQEDKNLKQGMVVQTLGLNKINDDYGAMYKIVEIIDEKLGENDLALKYKPHLKAERIDSSTFEKRLQTCETLLSEVEKVIGEGITTTFAELIGNMTKLENSVSKCDLKMDLYAHNVGVRIVLLGNGQKAVVVSNMITDGEVDEHITASIANDVVTIEVPLNDDVMWVIPSTLELLGYSPSTIHVNDNCTIAYTSGSESVPAKLTFTINRQLNPAVYYYI